ncbi:MAG: WecB/TagA/CpsF family glycosyltransferase [Schaedlerella sp.]|nr:WecB/TagA/CpsF family glycosyltransferase [Schaedlerella sp.]
MGNIINIFDLEVTADPAKDIVRRIADNLEKERIYTVELVTLEPVLQEKDNQLWKKQMQSMDLLIPGGKGVLGAEKNKYKALEKEIENYVLHRFLMRFLQKNRKTVYLIASSEENLIAFEDAIKSFGQMIRIVGKSVIQENGADKDKIINEINGLEPDCVFSALPSPLQENFIYENKGLLNTRVWVGYGLRILEYKSQGKLTNKIRLFILKKILHYHLEKQA